MLTKSPSVLFGPPEASSVGREEQELHLQPSLRIVLVLELHRVFFVPRADIKSHKSKPTDAQNSGVTLNCTEVVLVWDFWRPWASQLNFNLFMLLSEF